MKLKRIPVWNCAGGQLRRSEPDPSTRRRTCTRPQQSAHLSMRTEKEREHGKERARPTVAIARACTLQLAARIATFEKRKKKRGCLLKVGLLKRPPGRPRTVEKGAVVSRLAPAIRGITPKRTRAREHRAAATGALGSSPKAQRATSHGIVKYATAVHCVVQKLALISAALREKCNGKTQGCDGVGKGVCIVEGKGCQG